jgi:putative ABC transport system substrate-binding protein
MRRRDFLRLAGGAAAARSCAADARPGNPTIAAIMGPSPNEKDLRGRVKALESALRELGWTEGRNIHVEYRWADPRQFRAVAAEVAAGAPDVIVANGTSVLNAVREATSTIPIVFIGISDPEGIGIVASLARPGGNMTGVANFEPAMGGKWLQVLKEIAPELTRVGVLRVPNTHVRILRSIEDSAVSSAMQTVDCPVFDEAGVRAAIGAFESQPRTGLIVLPDPILQTLRSPIMELAARQRHPAIYPFRNYAEDGGLLSYGINLTEQVRRSAFYIDRILKGARPGDLPVEAPTKFELVINLKTAKALGLDVRPSLLARADEVIE